eukprot:1867000-Prymnesium_polylepis.2
MVARASGWKSVGWNMRVLRKLNCITRSSSLEPVRTVRTASRAGAGRPSCDGRRERSKCEYVTG